VRMMMGAQAVFEPAKPRFGVRIVEGAPEPSRMTPARKRAIEIASDGQARAKSALAAEAGCSTAVIDGLIEAGVLVEVAIPEKRYPVPRPSHSTVQFGPEQERAVHALRSAVDANNFSVTLLDGVTGSGKTEVYFEAVARAL
ncbi:MAG TPA: primosomal protein N', partial [Hyphomicrobiaceae bacterium]|nr:primosomal protein N' [Hyphomicrobiaceae bacterium]